MDPITEVEEVDVSPAAVTALEEELRRCQNEYVCYIRMHDQ